MKTNLIIFAAIIALSFAGCKGDQGDPGPQGPTGNANVSVSSITVQPDSWLADNYGGWYTTFDATGFADITQAAISIYWSTDDVNFIALPYTGYYEGAPDINYALNANTISVSYDAQTGVPSIDQPSNPIYFNVVVVPQPELAKMKSRGINLNNYSQVKAYLKLNGK